MSDLADSSTTASARALARSLAAELSSKFPCITISAALDPHFHDLDFLDDLERREVKDVVFNKMTELKKTKQDDDGQEAAPSPKIKKVNSTHRLSLLLGKHPMASTAPAASAD